MADNPELRGGRDRSRINAAQPYEVEYVHRKFPTLSHAEVLEAIQEKGPDRDDVIAYLEEKSKNENR